MMTSESLAPEVHLAEMERAAVGPFAVRYIPRERWELCGEMTTYLSVAIPMPEMSLQALLSLRAGMVVDAGWPAAQDVPLQVEERFLASVELEPVGDRLGVRINGFMELARSVATTAAAGSVSDAESCSLEDLKLRPMLRFGATTMSMREVLGLSVGDTVVLDRPVIAPVKLTAGGRVVASGDLMLVNGGYAVQIGQVAELVPHLPPCGAAF
jgi:flagellar motor switch protein FliN/FliY